MVSEHMSRYVEFKRNYHCTGAQCESQGFQFSPLLFDAHGGGWHPDVSGLLAEIARRQNTDDGDFLTEKLAQHLSITLQGCLARAALRRSVAALDTFQ